MGVEETTGQQGGQQGQPTGSRQRANQRGGQASPRLAGPGHGQYRMALGLGPGGSQGLGAEENRKQRGEGRGGGLGDWLPSILGAAGTMLGGPLGGVAGGMVGQALRPPSRAAQPAAPAPQPGEAEAYGALQRRALSGAGTMPAGLYQQALTQGLAGINAQTERSRQNLARDLGARGLLHSGLYAGGLADIERGRLGALSSLQGGLQTEQWRLGQQAQEAAANRYAQALMQGRQIEAQQPQWYDYLIQAAPAVGQYLGSRNQPDYARLLREGLAELQSPRLADITAPRGLGRFGGW